MTVRYRCDLCGRAHDDRGSALRCCSAAFDDDDPDAPAIATDGGQVLRRTLPGGLDPDELQRVFAEHDGNIAAVAREFDVAWSTAQKACVELDLHKPTPSLAHKLRTAGGDFDE